MGTATTEFSEHYCPHSLNLALDRALKGGDITGMTCRKEKDQGIMKHQDGPAYFLVATIISLKSLAVINFTPHSRLAQSSLLDEQDALNGGQSTSLNSDLLMPCSLLIFKDKAYSD